MVKEELTSEEKLFEKSVITERFLKKNKNTIIATIVFIILAVSANIAYEANIESTAVSANESLATLLHDDTNTQALADLKDQSTSLHDLYLYSKAVVQQDKQSLQSLKSSKEMLISELAEYESLTTLEELQAYTMKKGAIYKDLAQIRMAIIHINKGEIENAHENLRFIDQNSPLINVAQLLLHYGVK